MNPQPDKLFKQKLENYQRPAPVSAWSRIEAGRSKKNNKYFWLKIAASLLLLAVISYTLISINEADDNTIAQQGSRQENIKSLNETDSLHQEKKSIPSPIIKEPDQRLTEIIKTKETKSTVKGRKEANSNIITTEEALDINKEVTLQNDLTPSEIVIAKINEEVAPTTKKNFKLVIEADEVNKKYLKERDIAKATSNDESSSGIKKLLDKAQDLKNNQDPFGDLRQVKNEILALNFQTNKKHEQNK